MNPFFIILAGFLTGSVFAPLELFLGNALALALVSYVFGGNLGMLVALALLSTIAIRKEAASNAISHRSSGSSLIGLVGRRTTATLSP